MEIYALYGPSGTGKSTSALALAHRFKISAIIDDGILIFQGRKVAGQSAKYEKTTIQAVKRAIFLDESHRKEVIQALKENPIERLLILGTSQKMIKRIQDALELPTIEHFVHISDIRSSSEIKAALFERETKGRHAIPIPRLQVEQDFISRLISRVEKIILSSKKEEYGETTIVHPQFHAGQIHVSEAVLKKLVLKSCRDLPFVHEISKIKVEMSAEPVITLHLSLKLASGESIQNLSHQIQKSIYQEFLEHLNLEVGEIDLLITTVQWKMQSPVTS
ncbi:AAA family ATPase [Ammoniphilus resinae]|uniref:Alkaline shock family protein YloU n=1 Tax=Ammoniphilus resinae TaxID=861532 RepID=A0ABS4GWJ8_9BACL|nr:putative alkaline shock family protein YloU [Ammoniphilus resinae]